MLRMLRSFSKSLPLLALLGTGCGGTETGNPGATLKLRVRAHSSKPEVATTGAGSGVLSVEQAMASLTVVELVGCGNTGPIAANDLAVNLLADPPYELLFDTAVSDYCGLRLGLGPIADPPSELAGANVRIAGTRSDALPVHLDSVLPGDFELATAPVGTPFDASQLILGFDLGVWFDTVDVHGAVTGADGVVRLDATNNTTQLTGFEARTGLAIGLFLDNDGDGELDADELSPIATSN